MKTELFQLKTISKSVIIITFYPNPANNHLNIEALAENEITGIDIINYQGKLIESRKINNSHKTIDISELSVGLYILKTHTKNGLE